MTRRRKKRGDPPATTTPRPWAAQSTDFPWGRAVIVAALVLVGVRVLRSDPTPQRELPRVVDVDAGSPENALRASDLITHERTLRVTETRNFRNGCTAASAINRWVLPGYSAERARAFVEGAVDDTTLQASLLATLSCSPESCVIVPPTEAQERFSDATRINLFRTLSTVGPNPLMQGSFHRRASEGPFSAIPGMPESARPWLDRMEFTYNGRRTLVDTPALCTHVLTDPDRVAMFVALQSVSTLDAEVPTRVDTARFAQSFAPAARAEALAQLEAARQRGETSIPLRDFFPSSMRDRLNRYPTEAELQFNCFWSALRFSVPQPPWPLTAPGAIRAALPNTHRQVLDGSLFFGDLILFADAHGAAIHAVNYLVGSLVLTKNGAGHMKPWQVSRLDDITVEYPDIAEATVWRPL